MKVAVPIIRTDETRMEILNPSKSKFCVTTQTGHVIINKSEISHLVGDSNYTTIFFKESKVICSKTLGVVLKKLNNTNFVRIHKSHVINIDSMRHINSSFSFVKLNNGVQLPIARSQKQTLKNLINYKFD